MKKLLNWLHINPVLFGRLDAGEKNLITILALSVPVSSIVAGVVFFYSIQLLSDSNFLALLGASFIAYLMYLHDTSLMSEAGTGRAFARLFLSLLIAIVVAVPLKIKFMGDALEERLLSKINDFNIEVEKEWIAEKNAIYAEEKEIMAEISKAGASYDNNKKSQALVEARRGKDAFLENKEERLASLEKIYAARMKPTEVTKVDLAAYFFSNMFSKTSPKELFINLSVFILLLFVEALPAVVRLKLEEGKYLHKIKHYKLMKNKVDVEIEKLENQILGMENLEELPNQVEEVQIWKEVENVSQSGFKDVDKLVALAKQYKENQQPKTPPPPPPKDNNQKRKPDSDDFPQFDYSKT